MNLREALIQSGWKALDSRTHPRAYVDAAGTRYGTLEKAEVRVVLSIGFELTEEHGEPIVYLSDDNTSVIVRALIVDECHRQQGLAKATLQELCRWADETGTSMYLEAVPIEDKPVLSEDLSRLYSAYGFEYDVGNRMVMVRRQSA
ncbi:MAG: hypothetical protein ACD_23C00750G0003 [uncultured bacterium]|nr:MAG: hypothetical protein ACD_23C00750G0003 [uncultured bacterium]